MSDGSGVSIEQMGVFAVKASNAADQMEGAVTTLGTDLSQLPAESRGAWIRKFQEVHAEVQLELKVMNEALRGTSAASTGASAAFESGDIDQEQLASSVGSQVPGLTRDLQV